MWLEPDFAVRLGMAPYPEDPFPSQQTPLISWTNRSEGIDLVALHAFAAGTICHPLMEIPAKMTNPNRWDSERETVLTIAKVSTFIGFFRHTGSEARSTV